jgi:hypothetical protein
MKKKTLKEKAFSEAKSFSVMVGYAWVLFSLFDLHRWMVLRQYHIGHDLGLRVGLDLINAVVLGKVVFTAEALHIAERLKDRPLVQPILYKSAVFSLVLICFQIVEEVLMGKFHGKTISQSIPPLGGGGVEGFVLWGMLCFISLIPLFTFREISRVLGQKELYSLLFKRRTRAVPISIEERRRAG